MKTIAVVGVGNILLSDEGVGVHVVRELAKHNLPPNVKIYDCGTSGMAVLEAIDGADKAIIVDAVKTGAKPGTIHRYTIEEILEMEDRLLKMVSLHQFDLIATLKVGSITTAYKMPEEVIIVGVEIGRVEPSLELSREVKRSLPEVIRLILRELEDG